MKTTKFYLALSFVLIMTGMNAIYSRALNNTTGGTGSFNGINEITYVVNISPTDSAATFNGYYVMIVDDRGYPVCKPQLFHAGLWTYSFHETGFVPGSRTAKMVMDPHSIYPSLYIIPPSTMAGPFGPGRIYTFTLIPQRKTSNVQAAY